LPVPQPLEPGQEPEPDERWLHLPHVVLNGMTNSGKSTLINHLLRWGYCARASSVPGKTEDIDFYLVNDRFILVDLPGYPDLDQVAHFGVARNWDQRWEELVMSYLDFCADRKYDLRLLLQLQHSRYRPSPNCIRFAGHVKDLGLPNLLILTKDDQLTKGLDERNYFRRNIKNKLNYTGPHLHFTSDASMPAGRKSRKQLHRWIRSVMNEKDTDACVELIANAWKNKDPEQQGPAAMAEAAVAAKKAKEEARAQTLAKARARAQLLAKARAAGKEGEVEVEEEEEEEVEQEQEVSTSSQRKLDEATLKKLMPELSQGQIAFLAMEQAEAIKPVANWTVHKILKATVKTPTTWQYKPFNGLMMGLRKEPDMLSRATEELLKPGEVFKVRKEKRGPSGMVYLELADGRGWAFDKIPDGFLCRRKALRAKDLRKVAAEQG